MRYAYLLFQDIGPEKPMAGMQERRMEIQKKDDWKRKRKKLAPIWLLLLSIGAFSPAYRVEAAPAAADGVRAEEDSAGYGIEKKKAEIPADGTEKEPLEAPAGLRRGSLTYHSVKLYWEGVEGASYYRVEYSLDGENYELFGRTRNTKYKCKNILTGQNYYFRVCAVDAKGAAGSCSEEITAKPYLRRSAITMISETADHMVALEWKKVAGAQGYQVYRKTPEETKYTLLAETEEPVFTDTDAKRGVTYQYRVRAFRDVEGRSVKATLSVIAEITMALDTVQIKTCEPLDYKTVELAWEAVAGADGYSIYRSAKEDGAYKKLKTISGNRTLSYKDTTVVPGKTYYYKITAYWKTQEGDVTESGPSQAFRADPVMDAPKVTGPEVTDSRSLRLSWEKMEDAAAYRIYRSRYADRKYEVLADVDGAAALHYEDRAVEPGVTYYYKVKALYRRGNATGVSLADGCHSAATAPSAPVGLTLRQTATDELTVTWSAAAGASCYNLYRASKGNGKYTCIAKKLKNTSYVDTGLENGKVYYYKVSAAGESLESVMCHPRSYNIGGVELSSRTLNVAAGAVKQLFAYTIHEGTVVWKSADPDIAVVDPEGRVTGVSYGTTAVTATIAGKRTSATVSVTAGRKNGIDVSVWQKDVDWERVKAAGIDFAFLRISNHYLEDYTFETKYVNAAKAGIPVGVYCYSRAADAKEAAAEAETVIKILNGRKLDYPIAMDLEDSAQAKLGKTALAEMVEAFKDVVEKAGYQFLLYSYTTFLNANVDTSRLAGIDLWIARYRSMKLGTGYSGGGNERFWQYNSGQYAGSYFHVDGVTDEAGNLAEVDVNVEF